MVRLTKGSWGIVLLLGLLACTEDLTTPGYCPQTCPGGVVQVKDTVLDAVFDLDSSYSGYVFAGEGTGLLVSPAGSTDQYLATVRFGARPDSVRVGDSTYAYTIDSVAIGIGVLARDPDATGIVLQMYRAPATVDSTVTFAELSSYVTPASLMDTLVVPDTLESGNLRAVFSGADLLKVDIPPADSGILAIALGMTADSNTGVELGSITAGQFLPSITTYISVPALDSTKQPSPIQRPPTFATYVEQNPPVLAPDQLLLGSAPSSRIIVRFSVPSSSLVGVELLRAELLMTPVGPIAGVPGIPSTVTARGVLSDQGAKSPLVPLLAATTSLTVGSADTVTLEVLDLVKTWQAPENPPAQAFFLSLQPEASSFTRPVFASTRSLTGAPRLRITYVAPLDFEEP
jgi:hypothetical protein